MPETRTLRNKDGRTVETPFSNAAAIQFLKDTPAEHFGRFALVLYRKHETYGRLSSEQWWWVHFFCVKAKERMERENDVTNATDEYAVNLLPIVELLHETRDRGLKDPRVSLRSEAGQPVGLKIAGKRSSSPGAVFVTDGKSSKYFGRIHTDGRWEGPYNGAQPPEDVMCLLIDFAADPAGVGAEHGKLSGRCSFCKLELTHEDSLAVGYGPRCAKNWSLPWGKKATKKSQEVT